jgi:RHS repeat-associated protein
VLTAQSGWVGYPSSCTWTASGAGGSTIYTETMTTVAGASGSVTYIHTDGLGSPVARTDASGNVISRTRYEPYGYVASGVQPTIGFTGHVNDVDTGLTYMQQRYYDPVAGRFLSIDPVTTDANTGGSFNRYVYANNSPYNYVDPDGRQFFPITMLPPPPLGIPSRPLQNPDGSLPPSRPSGAATRLPSFPIINPIVTIITAAQILTANLNGNNQPQSPVINPADVAGKTPAEIGQVATGAGLVPKGPDPLGGRGSFDDPVTGEQRVLVHGDHAHVNDPEGKRLDVDGNRVNPKSEAAHLPVKQPGS